MVVTVTINPAVDKTYIVDNFKSFSVNRAQRILYNAGSNGINVSRVLKQVSRDSIVLGFVGGKNGDILLSELKSEGINEDMVRVSGDTRLNVKITDLATLRTTEVNEPGNPVSDSEYNEFAEKYRKHIDSCSAVVLSGSLLPEMNKREYFNLIYMTKKNNCAVFLDCDGHLMKSALEAGPAYVKPNYREFCDMFGKENMSNEEIISEAREIIKEYNVKYVTVTLSERGSIGVSKDETYIVTPPNIHVLSTVGAGDAYMAGLCHGYLNNFSFKTQLILATSFASAKITKEGNNIPSLVELLGYADGCVVQQIE